MITAEMKSRTNPSDPRHREHRGNPGNPGEGEAPAEGAPTPAAEGETGITPLAGENLVFRGITNYSIAPGFAWFELTNHAAISLAVGRQTVTAELPPRGGGEYMTAMFRTPQPPGRVVGQPVALLVLNPTVLEPADPNKTGMSVEGFPGEPKSLPVKTGLPVNVGVHEVEIDPNFDPPRARIYFEVRTAATIAAGKRWLFMTMTGV